MSRHCLRQDFHDKLENNSVV